MDNASEEIPPSAVEASSLEPLGPTPHNTPDIPFAPPAPQFRAGISDDLRVPWGWLEVALFVILGVIGSVVVTWGTAQVAVRQGRTLARQIEAELTGRERKPVSFKLFGEMVPLSRHKAVADLSGLKLVGVPAWVLWKTVYMLKLPTWAARLRVVLDWTVELFFERDVSELTVDKGSEA